MVTNREVRKDDTATLVNSEQAISNRLWTTQRQNGGRGLLPQKQKHRRSRWCYSETFKIQVV